jgi:hydroxypyruvate reductase
MRALVEAAGAAAQSRGIEVALVPELFEGEVGLVARRLMERLRNPGAGSCDQAWMIAAGGEATVVLPDRPGLGGRAHQLGLLLARELRGSPLVVLVAGSDGMDGNSGAAGVVVDGSTWDRLVDRGLDPAAHLARCDGASALAVVGAQVRTGPTGVNHADLVLAYRPGRPSG